MTNNVGGERIEVNTIYQGDSLSVLKTFPDESIDMIMTSPPYWSLRNYETEGQLGLEPTFQEYIQKLCDIFDEAKRVLKKEGTCWINIGDTYIGNGVSRHKGYSDPKKNKVGKITYDEPSAQKQIIPPKCLAQIPSRFAIEMTNRGWILRNEIIWHKPNCMPSPVDDRFTVDFEKIYFFTKNPKYYFQTQREPHKIESIKRACRAKTSEKLEANQYSTSYKDNNKKYLEMSQKFHNGELRGVHKDGKNKRTTWTIPTQPHPENHFAMYPETLIETPTKAGCPIGGIVLDPFFGSGTTGLVALKQGKNYVGIELNPEYIKIAENRLKPYKEQKVLNFG